MYEGKSPYGDFPLFLVPRSLRREKKNNTFVGGIYEKIVFRIVEHHFFLALLATSPVFSRHTSGTDESYSFGNCRRKDK